MLNLGILYISVVPFKTNNNKTNNNRHNCIARSHFSKQHHLFRSRPTPDFRDNIEFSPRRSYADRKFAKYYHQY